MRIPATFTDADIKDAHDAADVVASQEFRPYLPGRLLPMLIARFRDDTVEAMGLPLPPLPRRSPVTPAALDHLTSSELAALRAAVDALVGRFTACMDDPELPRLLAALREDLAAQSTDRERIAEQLTHRAKAS